jgi:hypothetical protein
MIWLLPTHFFHLSRQKVVSLSQSSYASPVELTDGKGRGKEWRRSPDIRRRESLVLFKSFDTLFLIVKALKTKDIFQPYKR